MLVATTTLRLPLAGITKAFAHDGPLSVVRWIQQSEYSYIIINHDILMRSFGWSTSICQGTYFGVLQKSKVGVDFLGVEVGDKKILVQVVVHTQSLL